MGQNKPGGLYKKTIQNFKYQTHKQTKLHVMPYLRKRRYPRTFRRYRRPFAKRRRVVRRFSRRGMRLYRRPVEHILERSKFVKLKYFDYWALASGAGPTFAVQQFRGNSIFDPDYSGVGGQPTGYTQLNALYNHYKVFAARITIRALSLTSNVTLMLGVVPLVSAWTPASGTEVQQVLGEGMRSRYVILDPANSAASAKPQGWVKCYKTTRQMLGASESKDRDTAALMTTNPVSQWLWNVVLCDITGAQSSLSVAMAVKITYYLRVYQPCNLFLD